MKRVVATDRRLRFFVSHTRLISPVKSVAVIAVLRVPKRWVGYWLFDREARESRLSYQTLLLYMDLPYVFSEVVSSAFFFVFCCCCLSCISLPVDRKSTPPTPHVVSKGSTHISRVNAYGSLSQASSALFDCCCGYYCIGCVQDR